MACGTAGFGGTGLVRVKCRWQLWWRREVRQRAEVSWDCSWSVKPHLQSCKGCYQQGGEGSAEVGSTNRLTAHTDLGYKYANARVSSCNLQGSQREGGSRDTESLRVKFHSRSNNPSRARCWKDGALSCRHVQCLVVPGSTAEINSKKK